MRRHPQNIVGDALALTHDQQLAHGARRAGGPHRDEPRPPRLTRVTARFQVREGETAFLAGLRDVLGPAVERHHDLLTRVGHPVFDLGGLYYADERLERKMILGTNVVAALLLIALISLPVALEVLK